jgi:hypothetical protein
VHCREAEDAEAHAEEFHRREAEDAEKTEVMALKQFVALSSKDESIK